MSTTSLEKLSQKAKQRGEPFRILIVDDEQWVREVFRDFCAVTDAFEVDLAADGAEAIRMAGDKDYDLVTLDLIMPDISGMDALTEIKKQSPQVPIMVITGNATDKLVNQAGILGACKVMYKPIQLDHFVSELASTLTR
ncbi:MAG: response regulator [candidate division Zixibacteria bacterium]|nr:response regulator [candidate division Zixibacteria bacterium]